jgi:hypothetical protein
MAITLERFVCADTAYADAAAGRLETRDEWRGVSPMETPTNPDGTPVRDARGREGVAGVEGFFGLLLGYDPADAARPHELELRVDAPGEEGIVRIRIPLPTALFQAAHVPVVTPVSFTPDGRATWILITEFGVHEVVISVDGTEIGRGSFEVRATPPGA